MLDKLFYVLMVVGHNSKLMEPLLLSSFCNKLLDETKPLTTLCGKVKVLVLVKFILTNQYQYEVKNCSNIPHLTKTCSQCMICTAEYFLENINLIDWHEGNSWRQRKLQKGTNF